MLQLALKRAYSILAIQSKHVEYIHILLDQSWGEELESLCCEIISVSLDQLKIEFLVPMKFSQRRIQSSTCVRGMDGKMGQFETLYFLRDFGSWQSETFSSIVRAPAVGSVTYK